MNRGTILFRVDGSATEGMGRVARCLALANALQRRRYQMTFISQMDGSGWPDRIRRFRHAVARTPHPAGHEEDRDTLLAEIAARNPLVVITDSAEIDQDYLEMLIGRVPVVISLDDVAGARFPSDLVLNPTLTRSRSDYLLYPSAQLLVGNRFAMIRSEFRRSRNVRATEPSGPARVIVALGGGANGPITAKICKRLLEQKTIDRVDAILGFDQGGKEQLDALAEDYPGRLGVAVDVRDLGLRMTKAHLLITGGGNTALEAACVGMPLLLLARCERHAVNATQLDEAGAAQYLGMQKEADFKEVAKTAVSVLEDNFERKAMSRSGRMLIDGRGADRIVTATEILLRRSKRSKVMLAA